MTGVGRGGGRIREGEKLGPSRHHCSLLATPRLDAPTAGGTLFLWHSSNTGGALFNGMVGIPATLDHCPTAITV